MIEFTAEQIASGAGAAILDRGAEGHPRRVVIDSREVAEGDLFVGIVGEHVDGGRFAENALGAGAWGVLLTPESAARLAGFEGRSDRGWILASDDPQIALGSLARAWRREIGCPLVGITGSTGKTSVKDIARAILPGRVHASPENFNTEIGMPLALLAAPADTEILVMEMAMRGMGQIAELCEIAEPNVAAITNIGPVHLELLGTFEAIVEAKAEILKGLQSNGRAVLPVDAEALAPHVGDELEVLTFGAGGDLSVVSSAIADGRITALIGSPSGETEFEFPFDEHHNLSNALCAIAIGVSLGVKPEVMATRTSRIEFSRLRGERVELPGQILLLNDCYNANPTSMRAAVEHLAAVIAGQPEARAVAVLGGMAELGPTGPGFHAEIGALVRERGIGPLIGVGDLARDYAPDEWVADADAAVAVVADQLRAGDVALIKGSRSVELERLTAGLRARLERAGG